MKYERKFILATTELREMLMSAWVDGWYVKQGQREAPHLPQNDDGKRSYSAHAIAKLIEEVTK